MSDPTRTVSYRVESHGEGVWWPVGPLFSSLDDATRLYRTRLIAHPLPVRIREVVTEERTVLFSKPDE